MDSAPTSRTDEERRAATWAWVDAQRRKRLEAAEKLSREFFDGTEQEIPDLEFNTPDCPVCWEATVFDDDRFICEVCEVAWPQNGYGHQAERFAEEATSGRSGEGA